MQLPFQQEFGTAKQSCGIHALVTFNQFVDKWMVRIRSKHLTLWKILKSWSMDSFSFKPSILEWILANYVPIQAHRTLAVITPHSKWDFRV